MNYHHCRYRFRSLFLLNYDLERVLFYSIFFFFLICHWLSVSTNFFSSREKYTIYMHISILHFYIAGKKTKYIYIYIKLYSRTFLFFLVFYLIRFFFRCGVVCSLDFYNLAATGWNSSYYFFFLFFFQFQFCFVFGCFGFFFSFDISFSHLALLFTIRLGFLSWLFYFYF